jgi:hypothetical protein
MENEKCSMSLVSGSGMRKVPGLRQIFPKKYVLPLLIHRASFAGIKKNSVPQRAFFGSCLITRQVSAYVQQSHSMLPEVI